MRNQRNYRPNDRRGGALDHWLRQEDAPLPEAEDRQPRREGKAMPSGWWLLPAMLLSVPAWFTLLGWLFG